MTDRIDTVSDENGDLRRPWVWFSYAVSLPTAIMTTGKLGLMASERWPEIFPPEYLPFTFDFPWWVVLMPFWSALLGVLAYCLCEEMENQSKDDGEKPTRVVQ